MKKKKKKEKEIKNLFYSLINKPFHSNPYYFIFYEFLF